MTKITAQTKDGSAQIDFEYEFGGSLQETIDLFGEGLVHSYAVRSLTIAAQGYARSLMKAGKSQQEILDAVAKWKPGEPRAIKSAEDKVREMIQKMSPEALEALKSELKVEATGKKGKAA